MIRKLSLPLFLLLYSKSWAISIIILSVDSNVSFDLSTVAGFPPPVFPGYYYPTKASGSNPEGIVITATVITIFWQTISRVYIDIKGGHDPSPTVALSQINWTITPAPLPPPGTPYPPPPWQPLVDAWRRVASFVPSGFVTRRRYLMDFCFKAEEDDDPTPSQGITTTVYIRFYGL